MYKTRIKAPQKELFNVYFVFLCLLSLRMPPAECRVRTRRETGVSDPRRVDTEALSIQTSIWPNYIWVYYNVELYLLSFSL